MQNVGRSGYAIEGFGDGFHCLQRLEAEACRGAADPKRIVGVCLLHADIPGENRAVDIGWHKELWAEPAKDGRRDALPHGNLCAERRGAQHRVVWLIPGTSFTQVAGAHQPTKRVAKQNRRHTEGSSGIEPFLNVIQIDRERIDVTASAAALTKTPVIERLNVISPVSKEPSNVLVPTGVFTDAVHQQNCRSRGGNRPSPPQLGDPAGRGSAIQFHLYISHEDQGTGRTLRAFPAPAVHTGR